MSKVALITGAAQGIGKSIALQLAKDGYKVAILDLPTQEQLGQEVVSSINKIGQDSLFIPGDVCSRSEIFNAVDKTFNKLGGFNTMINNAGIAKLGPLLSITPESWEKSLQTNISSTLWGIQASAKKFIELNQPGKIINAGSVASHEGFVNLGIYSVTKHGVKSLTQTAAKELASQKITVNSYCPGMIPTNMWDSINEMTGDYSGRAKDALLKSYTPKIAMGKVGDAQDVADLVSFLASEKSNYITGQSYVVDGGLVFN
ncbi:unnamed protein product [Wickerhamomyces anomalus]